MIKCPKCGSVDDVVSHVRFSSVLRGACHYLGSGLMYLSTPIGKGASQDEARRLWREAEKDFSDLRYHCNNCNTDFDI